MFFSENDKKFYLRLIKRLGRKNGLAFLAYCLMDNHVHLIVIPETKESLSRAVGETHRLYTTAVNIREEWKGYLWQGRFSSFPLSDRHLFEAVRYVELNPVRAGIVDQPEDYPWSSARARIFRTNDPLVSANERLFSIVDWPAYLNETGDSKFEAAFKRHQKTGRPMGDDRFLGKLETLTGRKLLPLKRGRKPKNMVN